MPTRRRPRPAIRWGVCAALALFLLVSFAHIWQLPTLPPERQSQLEGGYGTFWQSLDGIWRRRWQLTHEDILWDLSDNWIIATALLGLGFFAGCALYLWMRQAARGIDPPSW
jgi:hypothetical protein